MSGMFDEAWLNEAVPKSGDEPSMSPTAWHIESMRRAEAKGFYMVKSDARTLTLDIDDEESFKRFCFAYPLAVKFYGADPKPTRYRSKSGKGWHIVVKLDRPLPIATRLALQAALGSDGRREILNLTRMDDGDPEPSVLFQPKGAQPTQFKWEK